MEPHRAEKHDPPRETPHDAQRPRRSKARDFERGALRELPDAATLSLVNCAVPTLRLRRDKLLHVATRVFKDEAAARKWVRSPQPALDGAIPDELVDTLEGLERALSELESLSEAS